MARDDASRPGGRREFLEWLGKSAVVSLSLLALEGCGGLSGTGEEGLSPASGLEFRPGPRPGGRLGDWPERTVDRQDPRRLMASWRLTVEGLVEKPAVFTFEDLLRLPRRDQVTDFHCVEGWSVHDVPWNGLHARDLAERVRPLASATHVTLHTVGGTYNESVPLSVLMEPRSLLAYGVAGNTLPLRHGFPLRLVVPRLLGYKNAKYVERLEWTDHAEAAYWTVRGYDYSGEVEPSRLRPGKW